jgi:exonuclease I
MTKKEIKALAQEIMNEMDREGLDMEIVLDNKQLNKLADSIVDKLLTTYIREQATWYSTSTMDDIYNHFKQKPKRKAKKKDTESELLGELAKLMTQLNYHQENEEYEACAEIKKEIDIVNDKLSRL